MISALVRADFRLRRRSLLALGLGAFAFTVFFAGTYEAFGGIDTFNDFLGEDGSGFIRAFAGTRDSGLFDPAGYLAFGFNHPLLLSMTLAVGIGIGTSAIAGDVESGRAELLYPRPVRRTWVVDRRIGLWLVAQLAVLGMALGGTLVGTRLSADLRTVGLGVPVWITVQILGLALFVGALAFLVSARSSTRGRAVSVTVGLLIGGYLCNYVTLLWSPAESLRWLTPFGYYEPAGALDGANSVHFVLLSGAAALMIALTRVTVMRRDLV